MRRLRWADRQMRIWWPAVLALVGGAILATLGFVVSTVIDGRAQDRLRNDQLGELVEQQSAIIERRRRLDAEADAKLQGAISEIEGLLVDHFAGHDANVASKLNDTLHRIEVLLGRPAGPAPAPISPAPRHEPTVRTAPAPRPGAPRPPPAPATTTTTTTPDQKNCDRRPDGPRC